MVNIVYYARISESTNVAPNLRITEILCNTSLILTYTYSQCTRRHCGNNRKLEGRLGINGLFILFKKAQFVAACCIAFGTYVGIALLRQSFLQICC